MTPKLLATEYPTLSLPSTTGNPWDESDTPIILKLYQNDAVTLEYTFEATKYNLTRSGYITETQLELLIGAYIEELVDDNFGEMEQLLTYLIEDVLQKWDIDTDPYIDIDEGEGY